MTVPGTATTHVTSSIGSPFNPKVDCLVARGGEWGSVGQWTSYCNVYIHTGTSMPMFALIT